MERRRGIESPKKGAPMDEGNFEHGVYEQIDFWEAENKKFQKMCEMLLESDSFSEVFDILANYIENNEVHFLFDKRVEKHISNILYEALSSGKQDNNLGTLCTLVGILVDNFHVSSESLVGSLRGGMLIMGKDDEKNKFFFRESLTNERLGRFFGLLKQIDASITEQLLALPEIHEAAGARFERVDIEDSTEKEALDFLITFQLAGEKVSRYIKKRVEAYVLDGRLTPKGIQRLYEADAYYDETLGTDEAWAKLQQRYGITESHQEIRRYYLDVGINHQSSLWIKNVCLGDSSILRELLGNEEELQNQFLNFAMSQVTHDRRDDWLFQAMAEQGMVPMETFESFFARASSDIKIFIQRCCKETLDADIALTQSILGDVTTGSSYELVKQIKNSKDGDFSHIGIAKGGEAGIQELRGLLVKFKQDILREDFDTGQLLSNAVLYDFARGYLRINKRQFGVLSLADSVKLYAEQREGVMPLNEMVYQQSESVHIRTSEADKDFEYSEQFLAALRTLSGDINEARDIVERLHEGFHSKPFTALIEHLDNKISSIVSKLSLSLQSVPDEKKKYIDERIKRLEALDFRDIAQLEANLQVLMQTPETHSIARQIMFTFVYAKTKNGLNRLYKPAGFGAETNLDNISGAINFVDHIVYQETWSRYFNDKRSRNAFRKIASTRALEEEIDRMQKNKNGETGATVMKFVPTRGLLMEVSGSLADACWQDINKDLIAVEHPNFTSVTFVQNPEVDERIAGACMLIETESRDGEKLLVIRGLNPLENVINRLSVEDFYQKFTEYCKGIAERGGRRLAIVIDSHSGGSATNRPVLFQYLHNLELRKVVLASDRDTAFNRYVITNNTFLVD